MSADVSRTELKRRLAALEGEAEVRRLQARYALLCDSPCPDPNIESLDDRLDAIIELYTPDAVWEGVGGAYQGQFGRVEGHAGIREHFRRFWEDDQTGLLLNVHYLTSEHIQVEDDTATGQWVHVQPWVFEDGRGQIRSSRLFNGFRRVDGVWRITRTRTENVFIADLRPDAFRSFVTRTALIPR
ncbi:nuclear transport factor 2 family protein [Microbacterium sp. F51-2R]|uniref:nuclear transport factor 2 family protein n=1 Tax=Microbacterium sp. F51-2R TaxID=3445777 RepID=UPI003F9F4D3C